MVFNNNVIICWGGGQGYVDQTLPISYTTTGSMKPIASGAIRSYRNHINCEVTSISSFYGISMGSNGSTVPGDYFHWIVIGY